MDSKTLTAYAHRAEEYSAEWLAQPPPADIYELIKKFFKRGGKTIDVGCGSDRDTNWLNENGYPTIGVDGRLYSAFKPALILDLFKNDTVLHFEEKISVSSGKKVCRLVAFLS